MISQKKPKSSLGLIKDTNKASQPCCHLGCTHKVLDQSAIADIPQPSLNNENEIVIADSEETYSVCEGEG